MTRLRPSSKISQKHSDRGTPQVTGEAGRDAVDVAERVLAKIARTPGTARLTAWWAHRWPRLGRLFRARIGEKGRRRPRSSAAKQADALAANNGGRLALAAAARCPLTAP